MRYYVISSDGQRYGPADIATLNEWIRDSRLLPHQMVEDEASGQRMPASSVPGLIFPSQQQPGPAAPQQHYMRPGEAYDDGSGNVTLGWVMGILGLPFCCCWLGVILSAIGVWSGAQAEKKGHPQGGTVKIFNIVVLVLAILMSVLGSIRSAEVMRQLERMQ